MSTLTQLDPHATGSPLLSGKNAVLFGAAGDVGMAIAREFASQGASLYLAGRHAAGVDGLAAEIQDTGRNASAAEVDALDEAAVADYLDGVVREAGSLDIVLNLTGPRPGEYSNGAPALDLPLEHFVLPLTTLVRSQFLTARAAARHMVRQHSGVILFVTAIPSRGMPGVTAIGTAFGAMESLALCLATELGPSGVRVVTVRSGAMVDTRTIQQSMVNMARAMSGTVEQATSRLEQATLLKRLPVAADTARLAAFLASDGARTVTGAIVNASSGSVMD